MLLLFLLVVAILFVGAIVYVVDTLANTIVIQSPLTGIVAKVSSKQFASLNKLLYEIEITRSQILATQLRHVGNEEAKKTADAFVKIREDLELLLKQKDDSNTEIG